MALRRHLAAVAATLLAAGALTASAQTSPAAPAPATLPCTTSPQPQPCTAPKPAAGQGTPAERFPFPGETSTPTTPSTTPDAPAAAPDAPASKRFPFPGEDPAPATPASGSSSSSSSSSSNPAQPEATPDTPASDGAPAPSPRRLLKRVNPPGAKLQSADEREAEDLDIAHFYTQTGDLQGAYLRSQDAVKTAPDDPDAHCSLAESALKLNKRDQAIAEFSACLKLDPEPKVAKNARKQLEKLK